jgi:hypothetical protein
METTFTLVILLAGSPPLESKVFHGLPKIECEAITVEVKRPNTTVICVPERPPPVICGYAGTCWRDGRRVS